MLNDMIKPPADLIGIINISIGLQKLITDSNWAALPSNASHELVSRCEKLIYSRDWYEEVQAQLFKEDGSVNYTTAEFAFELDIDIWERLFDYLKQHPLESALFPYLLGFENDERPRKSIDFYRKKHQYLYTIRNSAFDPAEIPGNAPWYRSSYSHSRFDLYLRFCRAALLLSFLKNGDTNSLHQHCGRHLSQRADLASIR